MKKHYNHSPTIVKLIDSFYKDQPNIYVHCFSQRHKCLINFLTFLEDYQISEDLWITEEDLKIIISA